MQPEDDPNVARAEKALVQLQEAAISGNFMVDILPFLKYIPSWMPGGSFKAYAERVRPHTVDMRETPYQQGIARLVRAHLLYQFDLLMISQREGERIPSILSRSFAIDAHSCPDEEVVKDVAWVAYTGAYRSFAVMAQPRRRTLGGAETSHIVLSTFFAAMLLYPEVQKKGQEELDAYLGSRLPVFDDIPHLPYVRAIMLELLRSVLRSDDLFVSTIYRKRRWQSVTPLGTLTLCLSPWLFIVPIFSRCSPPTHNG